jgi:ribose transport system substrate-binding protein
MVNLLRLLATLAFSLVLIFPGHADPKKYRIALIVPEDDTYFWRAVHAGAIKAQREYTNDKTDIQLLWIAPHQPNNLPEELGLVGDAVGSGVDGIALAPLDPHALVPPVELAIRQKIPVVIIDQPLDYPLITSIVATSNYECGAEASLMAGKIIQEKGQVLVIRHLQSDAATIKRENGFLDGVRKYYDTVQVIAPDEYAGGTEEGAYQLTQKLLKLHGNEISAIFTADPMTTRGAHRALKDSGLSDRVKHVGFLLGDEAETSLKSGALQGLIVPDPFNLGYLSIKTLLESMTVDNLNDTAVQEILNPPFEEFLPTK